VFASVLARAAVVVGSVVGAGVVGAGVVAGFLGGVLGGVLGAGCSTPVDPRLPAQVSLQLGTRQSCGVFSGLDYETSCLAAVHVVVRDAGTRSVVLQSCTPLTERRLALGDILRGAPVDVLTGLSANRAVIFEVRGLQDVADPGADRCADADVAAHWLFWGESDVVDLASLDEDGGALLVPLFVDCRDCAYACPGDDCFGCPALGTGTCPVQTPQSFCVPGVSFQCDKLCNDDDDCFEGARTCLPSGVCDDTTSTGGVCSPCALVEGTVIGCGDGFTCVGPPGATRGFCAESCPDHFCVDGTRCNRLGNNLAVIAP
jgi:hypothetical protein